MINLILQMILFSVQLILLAFGYIATVLRGVTLFLLLNTVIFVFKLSHVTAELACIILQFFV